MRPVDLARELKLSTNTLRGYEARGLVPPAVRSPKGYRMYTEVHRAYFHCLRAMAPGFGMEVTSEVLRALQAGDVDAALWAAGRAQAALHREQLLAAETAERFASEAEAGDTQGGEHAGEPVGIGELSGETGVPRSALRYWEKEGLVSSLRDEENGYRKYGRSELRKVLLMRLLRSAVYSEEAVQWKEAVKRLDPDDTEEAHRLALQALHYWNALARLQLKGLHSLYSLCRQLELLE
ncbi:MerR family transcriptional regulator [Paenibacillus mucilaginosus]|uniref:Probable transcriptional regulator n=2 Tax=Paenibacillus mucilaginosus TaxID=61624 RepID=F8FN35_PAEMK|nr:MerR family transcriptional regulator [Paenibacillus mucilaginosus]AEI45705.1 probable transcriptional regulator [Paenibacillus mucilaginosus KNP414]AFC33371.1 putative transcriptional regulator [Paenibacillus mucilaginosus 3016]MCG7215106.1 MerR family DNA-binding transcriptional regulator [Paenibacillus mucilaginosus]WDM27095.1 MerR family DNA-binding transcriptional regulator [Paenibacillus mucilaginosus]WFA21785.1 MerR family DNA-binding transcriptional regulator [Paenibacillus mucilagi